MSRLDIKTPSRAQTVVEGLYRDMERRIAASPPGLCPGDMSLSFLQLCHAQTCGKCVPCRIGLGQLTLLINQVLDGEATMETIAIIEKTARSIVNTADCAIGRDAARLVVEGLEGFRDDYEEHVKHNRCLAGLQNPVPCVALCPAGVDIPGYMALVGEGRCADAVRLIRKDNPLPMKISQFRKGYQHCADDGKAGSNMDLCRKTVAVKKPGEENRHDRVNKVDHTGHAYGNKEKSSVIAQVHYTITHQTRQHKEKQLPTIHTKGCPSNL